MGVSIIMNGRTNVTPGWRSMMHSLILDEFGSSCVRLYRDDIPALERLRDTQMRGRNDPPFDWSRDIEASFNKIIGNIKKRGDKGTLVECIC
jgi:hypothetical protein